MILQLQLQNLKLQEENQISFLEMMVITQQVVVDIFTTMVKDMKETHKIWVENTNNLQKLLTDTLYYDIMSILNYKKEYNANT